MARTLLRMDATLPVRAWSPYSNSTLPPTETCIAVVRLAFSQTRSALNRARLIASSPPSSTFSHSRPGNTLVGDCACGAVAVENSATAIRAVTTGRPTSSVLRICPTPFSIAGVDLARLYRRPYRSCRARYLPTELLAKRCGVTLGGHLEDREFQKRESKEGQAAAQQNSKFSGL